MSERRWRTSCRARDIGEFPLWAGNRKESIHALHSRHGRRAIGSSDGMGLRMLPAFCHAGFHITIEAAKLSRIRWPIGMWPSWLRINLCGAGLMKLLVESATMDWRPRRATPLLAGVFFRR